MPDFLYEWRLFWLNYWHDHPYFYWAAIGIAIAIGLVVAVSRRR